MISFCQTIPTRNFNNLWQTNRTCQECFTLQHTWIGVQPCWTLTVDDPLSAAATFQHVPNLLILVDFLPEVHHEIGGEFAILALTSEIIHCRGFTLNSANHQEVENVYIDPKVR